MHDITSIVNLLSKTPIANITPHYKPSFKLKFYTKISTKLNA